MKLEMHEDGMNKNTQERCRTRSYDSTKNASWDLVTTIRNQCTKSLCIIKAVSHRVGASARKT